MSDFYDHSFTNHALFKYLFLEKLIKIKLKVYFTFPELSSYFHQELDYAIDNEVNISGNLKIEPLEVRINNLGLSVKFIKDIN